MSATFPKAGPTGATGSSGISPYTHNQGAPSSMFTVTHGLGRTPVSVTAFDPSGFVVQVGVQVLDANHIQVTTETGLPFSGKVLVI